MFPFLFFLQFVSEDAAGLVPAIPVPGLQPQKQFEYPPFPSSLRHLNDRHGGDELASKCARVSGWDVNDIVVHPVDEAVMIPNDAHMIDANGILEHDPAPASGNAKH